MVWNKTKRVALILVPILVTLIGLASLIMGLIPNRLQGGHARITGPYAPADALSGFALQDLDITPPDRPPTSDYAKIIGRSFVDPVSGEHYQALAMKHDGSQRDFVILFNTARLQDILTSEKEKKYSGDVVLTPIALVSWKDLIKLHRNELTISDIEPTGFPEDCKFRTLLTTWMSLKYEYWSTFQCQSDSSAMAINGKIHSDFGSIAMELWLRIGEDEFTIGKPGTGRTYAQFGKSISAPQKSNNDRD